MFVKYVNAMNAAKLLGCSRQRVWELLQQKRIHGAQRIGHQYMIPEPVRVILPSPVSQKGRTRHTYGYADTRTVAIERGITVRKVLKQIKSGEIKGARKLGNRTWIIPTHYNKIQEELLSEY